MLLNLYERRKLPSFGLSLPLSHWWRRRTIAFRDDFYLHIMCRLKDNREGATRINRQREKKRDDGHDVIIHKFSMRMS